MARGRTRLVPPLIPTPVQPPPASTVPTPTPAPKLGFKEWRRTQDFNKPWRQMSDRRHRQIKRDWKNLPDPAVPATPTYNNPIQGNGSFFDPNSGYGYAGPPLAQTPIQDIFLEQNPDAAWMRELAQRGIDLNSAEGQWAMSQLGRVKTGWNAALASNPQLRQRDYLDSINIRQMFANMSPRQRGENPGLIAPRARTISRGYG